MVVDSTRPEIRINATNPPIKPPFKRSKFDLTRRIKSIKTVAFNEAIFAKVRGANGFSSIYKGFNILNNKNKLLKSLKKKKTKYKVFFNLINL